MSNYWAKRYTDIENRLFVSGTDYLSELEKEYARAAIEIRQKIESFYARFANNNSISYADAKRILSAKELKELRWTLKEYTRYAKENALNEKWIKELENASIRARMERLQALELQIRHQLEVLYASREKGLTKLLSEQYGEGYYRSMYEVQKYEGMGYDFQTLPSDEVDKVVSKAWAPDDKHFSERIWTDRNLMVNTLNRELTQSLIIGRGLDEVTKVIMERLNVSKSNAFRLVRTEANYYANAAFQASFKEMRIDTQIFVATLDMKTSAVCRAMDGKIVKTADIKRGINAPTLHVYCRSVMAPYYEGNIIERAARGKDGKTYNVPGDITYKEWYNKYVKPHETPTGKGDWQVDDAGRIKVTQKIPLTDRYKPKLQEKPNSVISHGSAGGAKGKRQRNLSFYDENGFLAKQIHYGHHGNAKKHNYGTEGNPQYIHVHIRGYTNGKPDTEKDIDRIATEEERGYLDD